MSEPGLPAADAAIRQGSKSFAAASRLFDPETRLLVWQLYAWCRHCDDVVDGQSFGRGAMACDGRLGALDQLRRHTAAAVAGAPGSSPPFSALADVVRHSGLPAAYVNAHLDGFAMDVSGRHYETIEDTLDYCFHVAGVVGLMMAWLMGVRDGPTLLRGCDLGLAFQLTNIARDVGDDAAAGRVYLPAAWLREAGGCVKASPLMAPPNRAAVVKVAARLLDEADRYYRSADAGVARLPLRCAWAVAAARHVYSDIGTIVRQRGDRAWDSRASTSSVGKLARLTQACGEAAWARAVTRFRPLPERGALWVPSMLRA